MFVHFTCVCGIIFKKAREWSQERDGAYAHGVAGRDSGQTDLDGMTRATLVRGVQHLCCAPEPSAARAGVKGTGSLAGAGQRPCRETVATVGQSPRSKQKR